MDACKKERIDTFIPTMMNFPKKPKEKWNKKVLLEKEVSEIKLFYEKNKNIRKTARVFNISRTSVRYHCFPQWREEKNQKNYKRKKDLYNSDLEYRKRIIERCSKNAKLRRESDPLVQEYNRQRSKKIKKENKNNPEYKKKISEANRKAYLKRKLKYEK